MVSMKDSQQLEDEDYRIERVSSSLFEKPAKIVLIGDSGVGKSSLLYRYQRDIFHEHSQHTVGVEFGTKTIVIDGDPMKIQIWDTAGQEQYRSLTVNFYRNAQGAILVYDMTDANSFENIKAWLGLLRDNGPKKITKILVGNKCDSKDKLNISNKPETLQKYLEENEFSAYFETSAKDNINVHETFENITRKIKEVFYPKTPSSGKIKASQNGENSFEPIQIRSSSNNLPSKDRSSCCGND